MQSAPYRQINQSAGMSYQPLKPSLHRVLAYAATQCTAAADLEWRFPAHRQSVLQGHDAGALLSGAGLGCPGHPHLPGRARLQAGGGLREEPACILHTGRAFCNKLSIARISDKSWQVLFVADMNTSCGPLLKFPMGTTGREH